MHAAHSRSDRVPSTPARPWLPSWRGVPSWEDLQGALPGGPPGSDPRSRSGRKTYAGVVRGSRCPYLVASRSDHAVEKVAVERLAERSAN